MFFNLKIHQNFKSWSTLQHFVMDYPVDKKFHSNMIVQRYSDGFFEQKTDTDPLCGYARGP